MTGNKTLNVLYFNSCSILNKLDELSAYVFESQPDVVAVCETWGYPELNNSYFNLPGYEIVCRNDRVDTSNGVGGGLLMYVRSDMTTSVVELSNDEMAEFVQCVGMQISLENNSKVNLILIYRPHHLYKNTVIQDAETAENNDKLCNMLKQLPKPYVIVGDLNYSDIGWDTLSSSNGKGRNFIDATQENFLTQHVDFPTHSSGTQPDAVLSSSDNVLGVAELCHLGSSDHSMIMVSIAGTPKSNVTYEEVPDWRNADIPRMRHELDLVNWEQLNDMNTLDSWDLFKNEVWKAEERCVPTKRRRVKCRPLWMQQNVMRTIRKKRRLWATYKKTRDYEEYLAYKRVEKETKRLVREAKVKFEKKLAKEAKKNPKKFYSYLRSKTANRTSVGPLKEKEQVVSGEKEMATILNKFFTSVFTVENPVLPEQPDYNVSHHLDNVEFPTETISEKIRKQKVSGAWGPDKIGPRLLHETEDILCAPLSVIFRHSLEENVVPDDWRRANITPIFKSGSKLSAGNYRPISLTSIICKIMESIIRDGIVAHLLQEDLIRSSQHGFMALKSCQTNLIEYLDTLTRLVDEGHNVDVVYLDFAKAFDKVPHKRLLLKLEAHGISGNVLGWIQSWLAGRTQRVVLNGQASEWMPVSSGVPQGSVLGPTCFVVFINDIDEVVDLVSGFISKFADDTKYGRVIRSEEDRVEMQRDIDRLLAWADKWQMEFNSKKCKVMHLGRSNPSYTYCMGGYAPGGTILEEVTQEKDLGVIVSNNLKPSLQCAKAVKKANSVLGQMRRSFYYRDKSVWVKMYKTFVRHHMELSVQAWSPWLKKDIELLEQVQKRAVDMVVGLSSTSYNEKLKELKLLSLEDRRLRGDLIQVWKYVHGINTGCDKLFKFSNEQHSRSSRHTTKRLNICRVEGRLEIRKNFYTVRVADKWNSLPCWVQEAEDIDTFKKELDAFMFTN